MKLEDLLEVYNPHSRLLIEDYCNGEIVGEYNGKDSLDPKYNSWIVEFICPWDSNTVAVHIRED